MEDDGVGGCFGLRFADVMETFGLGEGRGEDVLDETFCLTSEHEACMVAGGRQGEVEVVLVGCCVIVVLWFPFLSAQDGRWICLVRDDEFEWPAEGAWLVGVLPFVEDVL